MENPEAFCLHLKDMVKQVSSTMLLGISQCFLQSLPLLLGPQLSFPQGNHTRMQVDACCERHEVTHIHSHHHLITIEGLGKYAVV